MKKMMEKKEYLKTRNWSETNDGNVTTMYQKNMFKLILYIFGANNAILNENK